MTVWVSRAWRRRISPMLIDLAVVSASYFTALNLRFEAQVPASYPWLSSFLPFTALAAVVYIGTGALTGVYHIVNRHIGLNQALRLAQVIGAGTIALLPASELWPGEEHAVPLSVTIIGGILTLVAMTAVRFYSRIVNECRLSPAQPVKSILIVGAGQAAEIAIREIDRNPGVRTQVVGLVDDDPSLQGMSIDRHRVLGSVEDVPKLVAANGVDEILVAIPSASPDELWRIHKLCRAAQVPIRSLPSLGALMNGELSVSDARELEIEDLLGRAAVETDLTAIRRIIEGRSVLVTGAAGSIGSELCRQIAAFQPAHLVLVDKDESALYLLHEELRKLGARSYSIHPTSVVLRAKMRGIFADYQPDLVFHAAALKHVPLMELNPDEAIVTNVRGTLVVTELAALHGAERIVNISTDKAVDPVNVMGATKRVGEQIVRLLSSRYPKTKFCSVRFGNVLGSRGSVIPVFTEQIKSGGPVTITDPAMTRYFMTISESVQLVLQAAALVEETPEGTRACSGAFVLEMGAAVPIVDLARKMIDFLTKGEGEIEIDFTGIRPGEKLHEALYCEGEAPLPTEHPLIRLASLQDGEGERLSGLPPDFPERLIELIDAAERSEPPHRLQHLLRACVPTYQPFKWGQTGELPWANPPLCLLQNEDEPDNRESPGTAARFLREVSASVSSQPTLWDRAQPQRQARRSS